MTIKVPYPSCALPKCPNCKGEIKAVKIKCPMFSGYASGVEVLQAVYEQEKAKVEAMAPEEREAYLKARRLEEAVRAAERVAPSGRGQA